MKRKTIRARVEEGQPLSRAVENTIKSEQGYISRVKKRLEVMLQSDNSYFITFTIKPEKEHIAKSQIIKAIKKALGSARGWLFNEDYGKERARLHYHAVASYKEQLDYNTIINDYKYGAVNFKPIIAKNEKAIREYLLKITHHALKETAGNLYRSRRRNDV